MSSNIRTQIFISYAHKDIRHLKRLQVHLAPFIRNNTGIRYWDDTQITPGANWQSEIKQAIETAKVAILLVSADFLASPFIVKNELPQLLAAAKKEDALILSVILSPCAFEGSELDQFQSMNHPSVPLSKMTYHQRENKWLEVATFASSSLAAANRSSQKETAYVGDNLWKQYEVREIVTRTAHSLIVKAWDMALHQFVAIKLIYTDQLADEKHVQLLKENLAREARIINNLHHDNLAGMLSLRTDPIAIVMPWIEGESLAERLHMSTMMQTNEVIHLGIQLADALFYLHARGIIHNDIKPANIIFNKNGIPVLIDFDIAHSVKEKSLVLQEDGKIAYVGTQEYSAPEIFRQPGIGIPASDIFSLGVVLYQALTNQRPYPFGNNPANYNGQFPKPEQHDIPEPLYKILCDMLNLQPQLRPSAKVVQRQLQACLNAIGDSQP